MKKLKGILSVIFISAGLTACTGIGVGVGIPIGPVSVGLETTIPLPKGSASSSGKAGKVNGRYVINGSGMNKTVTLKGEPVVITGSMNKLTIRGEAVSIRITGSDNTVDADYVQNIAVEGENNIISYKRSSLSEGPVINMTGENNGIYKK